MVGYSSDSNVPLSGKGKMSVYDVISKYVVVPTEAFTPSMKPSSQPPDWDVDGTNRKHLELMFYDMMERINLRERPGAAIVHTGKWKEVENSELHEDVMTLQACIHTEASLAEKSKYSANLTQIEEPVNNFNPRLSRNCMLTSKRPERFSGEGLSSEVKEASKLFLFDVERFAEEQGRTNSDVLTQYVAGRAKVFLKQVTAEGPVEWRVLKSKWKNEFQGREELSDEARYYGAQKWKTERCYQFIWRVQQLGEKAKVVDLQQRDC